jgi:hypothetical protein
VAAVVLSIPGAETGRHGGLPVLSEVRERHRCQTPVDPRVMPDPRLLVYGHAALWMIATGIVYMSPVPVYPLVPLAIGKFEIQVGRRMAAPNDIPSD